MVPTNDSTSQKRKHPSHHNVTIEEVEDEDSPRHLSAQSPGQTPFDDSIILEQAPCACSGTSSAKNKNKVCVTVWVIILHLLTVPICRMRRRTQSITFINKLTVWQTELLVIQEIAITNVITEIRRLLPSKKQ